jgi:hypothetical protein
MKLIADLAKMTGSGLFSFGLAVAYACRGASCMLDKKCA